MQPKGCSNKKMDIFSALADPTRRHIIENLFQNGPQSIKQLGQEIPITRQALTKHLNRLIKAKLIKADFVGKEKIHTLQTAPMESLASWIAPFAKEWDIRLDKLETLLGNQDEK